MFNIELGLVIWAVLTATIIALAVFFVARHVTRAMRRRR
jgi:large-conductance mechanosensitive channel